MSAELDTEKDEDGLEAEKQVTAMRDQLNQEVAAWSKARGRQSKETARAAEEPVMPRRSSRSADESKKSRASPPPDKRASARPGPFSMSYRGMTEAQYVQYLRDRGSS
jgi:hypothetical protein